MEKEQTFKTVNFYPPKEVAMAAKKLAHKREMALSRMLVEMLIAECKAAGMLPEKEARV